MNNLLDSATTRLFFVFVVELEKQQHTQVRPKGMDALGEMCNKVVSCTPLSY